MIMREPNQLSRQVPSRRMSQDGSTLLEVMVGALIVAIISIQMTAFFARGRHWFDQEEHKRAATLLAKQALEEATATDYASILPWTDQDNVAGIVYSTTVTVLVNVPEQDMKTVRAVVSWPATASVNRSVTLSTLVYGG